MTSPDPTLLLQDLLSPLSSSYNQQQTLQLVTYHLSTLPVTSPHLDLLSLISRYSLTSPSLWSSIQDTTATRKEQVEWNGAFAVYKAFSQATLLRLDSISRDSGTGYRARRLVASYIKAVSDGIWADSVRRKGEEGWGRVDPVHRLLVSSALLGGLQEWKRMKQKLWVGGRGMMDRAELEVGKAWQEWTENGDPNDPLPAWIAAQTLSSISAEVLAKAFPSTSLLSYLSDTFSYVFDEGNLFTSPPIAADLAHTDQGLEWRNPSPSHSHLTKITQSPLFAALGPLSRAVGRLLSSTASLATSYDPAVSDSAITSIRDLSNTLYLVTTRLSTSWAATSWSDLVEDSALSPSTRSQTQPWTILKSLLFAQTLIYSSLLEVVSSTASDSEGEPTVGQRELAREAVVALGRTYFVASRFGQGGFKAWRAVLAGLVDVAAAPSPSSSSLGPDRISAAEQLARQMEPLIGDTEQGQHSRLVHRAECAFWMNTVEQIVDELSDSYVEGTVLPRCRPYLVDSTYAEPFESAHSVVLAIFSTGKASVADLAPWYTELLLSGRLPTLSPTQLRLAYSTVVQSVSNVDDALAWWCIRELVDSIERLPASSRADSATSLAVVNVNRPPRRQLEEDDSHLPANVESTAVADKATIAPPTLETRSLNLHRGALLLALVSLLPSVNFVLFQSLLTEIARLVSLEAIEHDGRKALGEWIFEVLGTGMDVVKREEGVRWWLENGRDLIRGGRFELAEEKREDDEQEKEKDVSAPSHIEAEL